MWIQGLTFLNFVRVPVKGVSPHNSCGSKHEIFEPFGDVSRCEVSDVRVGLHYKNEAFYLFLGIFPESELSELFL